MMVVWNEYDRYEYEEKYIKKKKKYSEINQIDERWSVGYALIITYRYNSFYYLHFMSYEEELKKIEGNFACYCLIFDIFPSIISHGETSYYYGGDDF